MTTVRTNVIVIQNGYAYLAPVGEKKITTVASLSAASAPARGGKS
jgi:hypothetical protein